MFGKKMGDEGETVIRKGAEFKGTLNDRNSIYIDGKFEGKIISQASVVVGEDAVIKGDIEAKSAAIGGKIMGSVVCKERVEIFSSGSLEGKITTSALVVAKGAFFNGQCTMVSSAGQATGRNQF